MSFDLEVPDSIFIDTQDELDKLILHLHSSTVIALDTEFVRTRTYYAQLGLIQLYDGEILALIDPTLDLDFSHFWALLTNPNILKVLHSASEDLEIFAHYGGIQPTPFFDSQIGAGLAQMGHGLGYANLVKQTLGIELDKGESRTDWLKRPLSDKQLSYAANDVFYLYHLFFILKAQLEQLNRHEWAIEESAEICQGRLDEPDFANAYLKVKNAFQLTPVQLAYLKPLAQWRLKAAIKKDIALGFIVKDNALIALAKACPKNFSQLMKVQELAEYEKRKLAKSILSCLENADLNDLPPKIDVIAYRPDYKRSFKTVKAKLIAIAESNTIPVEMLASKKFIHDFLNWYWSDTRSSLPKVLTGWRGGLTQGTLVTLEL